MRNYSLFYKNGLLNGDNPSSFRKNKILIWFKDGKINMRRKIFIDFKYKNNKKKFLSHGDGFVIENRWQKRYYLNFKLHRVDGPAIEEVNGNEYWCLYGKFHRIGGPAITSGFGINFGNIINKKWYFHGKLHRIDGPAAEYINGTKEWYYYGVLHRLDGPAIEEKNKEEWWYKGKRHKIGGPAIKSKNGEKEWWVNGKLHNLHGPAIIKKHQIKRQYGRILYRNNGPAIIGDHQIERFNRSVNQEYDYCYHIYGIEYLENDYIKKVQEVLKEIERKYFDFWFNKCDQTGGVIFQKNMMRGWEAIEEIYENDRVEE